MANFEADTAENGRANGLEELEELAAPELPEVPEVPKVPELPELPELPEVLKLLEVLALLDGRDVFDADEVDEVEEEVDDEVVAFVVPKLGLNEPEVGVTEGGAGACSLGLGGKFGRSVDRKSVV